METCKGLHDWKLPNRNDVTIECRVCGHEIDRGEVTGSMLKNIAKRNGYPNRPLVFERVQRMMLTGNKDNKELFYPDDFKDEESCPRCREILALTGFAPMSKLWNKGTY